MVSIHSASLNHLARRMTTYLPPELLIRISKFLRDDDASLAPCASVCRSWQMAFEPLIYTKLPVYSDEDHEEDEQLGISLTRFQKLTPIRQSWIRELQYDILVLFKICAWLTRRMKDEEDYSTSHPTQKPDVLDF